MKKYLFSLLPGLLCLVFSVAAAAAPAINYTLRMPEPHTHYFEVEMQISGLKQPSVDVKLPVWAPGSYLVREFAKNVEGFEATAGKGQKLKHVKSDKNTWRISADKADPITVKYRVYAYELSVRTSFIDASHGYLNGTSVFMYVEGQQNQPVQLTVIPHQSWSKVSTSLQQVSEGKGTWVFKAPDYDVLVDSPIEIGNHKTFGFKAAGVDHTVAMYGEGNYDEERLKTDMAKIVEEATKVWGENPAKNYVFIVHNTPGGGGGLEHLNSTTLQTSRWSYKPDGSYFGFLSLVAHEYFHLWNVKRLRPKALGPFNYTQENYTTALWFSEGVTSYYDDNLVKRAGYYSPEQYLDILAGSIGSLENQPGTKVQSVAESSLDAWIKYYRRSENTPNAEVSYYTKGGVLGLLLDLEIRGATQNKKSLDDGMRYLYDTYYKKLNRGFTDEELQQGLETVAGKSLQDFFSRFVYGTDPIDYNRFFGYAGLQMLDLNASNNEPYLGASTSNATGKLTITGVTKGSPAFTSGLNVNDELLAFDNYRVSSPDELNRMVQMRKPGDKVKVTVSRDGRLQTLDLSIAKNPNARFRIEPMAGATPQQEQIRKSWLRIGNS